MTTILTNALVEYLESENIGVFGTDIFIGTRPSEPIDCLTLYNTGGFPPQKDTTSDPTIQIISRSEEYLDGLTKLFDVHDLFKEKYGFWLDSDGIWVIKMEAQGEPGQMGKDSNGHHLFSANYHLWVRYY